MGHIVYVLLWSSSGRSQRSRAALPLPPSLTRFFPRARLSHYREDVEEDDAAPHEERGNIELSGPRACLRACGPAACACVALGQKGNICS